MRDRPEIRACARSAIAIGVLSCLAAVPTPAAARTPPAIAVRGDKAYVAWSAGGVVQIATMKPAGTFGPGVAVGTAADAQPPQLAITAAGDQLLLWQSEGTLRSAFRAVGPRQPWRVQTVATSLARQGTTLLATDPGGRAIAVWSDGGSPGAGPFSVNASTRPAGGAWSARLRLGDDARDVALASDTAGDAVVLYTSGAAGAATGAAWVKMLPAGAASWTPATRISGTDGVLLHSVSIAGGGAATFVAGWSVAPPVPSAAGGSTFRAVRLRLPGGWTAPQDVLTGTPGVPGASMASVVRSALAVDGLGTAVALLQFPSQAQSEGIGVTHLPASGAAWTPPGVLGQPQQGYAADGAGAVALADDGSAVFAFARYDTADAAMHVASTRGTLDEWQGADLDLGEISTCLYNSVCGVAWRAQAVPVLAVGSVVAATAVESAGGLVLAFTRTRPDGQWSGPFALQAAGPTTGRLLGPHIRKGALRAEIRCSLPPCSGTMTVRASGAGTARLVGGFRFTVRSAAVVSPVLTLRAWARARLAGGHHLVVRLTFSIRTGDGVRTVTGKTVRLSR